MRISVPSVGGFCLFCTAATGDNYVQLAEVSNLASKMTETSVCVKANVIACPRLITTDLASVDEHLQRVGAESFDLFQRYAATPVTCLFIHESILSCVDDYRRVNNLDKEVGGY
jgi:hypothetical protein